MNQVERSGSLRRYDIDWLRNLGILLLFPFHAARIFDHWEPNYVQNSELSWGLSWFIALSSYWFMPLLFWLAGSSSWYALQYRSAEQYVRERFYRLFIPLVFGVLVIVPPQGYFARLSKEGFEKGYSGFLKEYFIDFSDLSGYYGSFTGHLWFILYLFVFSLVALPLFMHLISHRNNNGYVRWRKVLSTPWVFLLFFIPLTLMEALPAPGGKNPFYYLFLFFMGYYTSSDERFQAVINKYRFKAFLFLIAYIPLWFFLIIHFRDAGEWSPISIGLAFMRNLAVWVTLMVILSYGHKYLNFKHKWLPYMNEAAFPVYILHQTVMMVVGYWVIKLSIGIAVKFMAINIATFVVCLVLYEYILKRVSILRVLFGIKQR